MKTKELNLRLQYKKNHLLFLRKLKTSQKEQIEQKKTFEHIYLINSQIRVIKPTQLESLRRAVSKKVERLLRFYLYQKIGSMVTAKPREIRMGKGKGAFSHYVMGFPIGSSILTFHWCHYGLASSKFVAMYRGLRKSNLMLRGF